jgi:hypothetical protein
VANHQVLQPPLRVSIFGEDNDALVVPRAIGLTRVGQPVQESRGLGVRAMRFLLGPLEHPRKVRLFLFGQRLGGTRGGRERVLRPLVQGVVGIDVLVEPVELGAQAAFGHVLRRPLAIQRAHVLAERFEEGL